LLESSEILGKRDGAVHFDEGRYKARPSDLVCQHIALVKRLIVKPQIRRENPMNTGQNDHEHAPTTPPTRRLFLAVPLTDDVRETVADISKRLQTGARFTALQASWVPPQNFHMTLHFLGGVAEAQLANLEAALRTLEGAIPPFHLSFSGLGYFPHAKAPRVLWLGASNPAKRLPEIVRTTGEAIEDAGIELKHQNFHAHITMARFKSQRGTAAFVSIARNYAGVSADSCKVTRLVLMESLISAGAPEYREVMEIPLLGVCD